MGGVDPGPEKYWCREHVQHASIELRWKYDDLWLMPFTISGSQQEL